MTVTDDIKQRLDLVDLITSSGVALRKAGRNWTGFCPFHANSRTPAFFVFTDTQSYYCFSCHVAGDAFNFVMARQGVDFTSALEQLAARTGVQLHAPSAEQEAETAREATLRQINEDAAVYWSHILRKSQRGVAGREYAAARGLDDTVLETWQLGYAPDDWSSLLVYLTDRKNHAPEDIEAAGLILRRESGGYYDRFRHRLMFPIRNHKGVIVGFGGRTLGNDHAKYMNTPETPLFHKSNLLFGLYEGREAIRRADSVVLVEGYLDVITAHQAGFANVVAPMGTALTADQVGLIKKLTRTITLVFDADSAGNAATLKGLATLRDQLNTTSTAVPTPQGLIRWERVLDGTLQIATLPPGQDPDEVIRADPAHWRAVIAAAQPLVDFYLHALTADLDLQAAKGRAAAVERLAPVIGALGEPVERAHYVQQLARLVGLAEPVIQSAVEAARRGHAQPISLPTAPQATNDLHQREDELLSLLLRFPGIRPTVESSLRGELPRFPELQNVVRGDVREALRRTENRLIWDQWCEHPPDPSTSLPAWVESLAPVLRNHALTLVQWLDTPPFPVYGPHLRAAQIAETIALELRKTVVQQRRQHIKAMYEAVTESDEQHVLLAQLTALNHYQSIITAPRRSTYFLDLGSRLEHLG